MVNNQNVLVNISGISLGFDNSHTVSLTLLCGLSGTQVIPLNCSSEGWLIVGSAI